MKKKLWAFLSFSKTKIIEIKNFIIRVFNRILNWLANLPSSSKEFFYENLGISGCLHLLILSVMITSFVIHDRVIVAPEKMKIIDVDLSQVKITKNKTNVSGDNKPISSIIEKGQGKDKNKVEKTSKEENKVMMVRREGNPLMRTMTISVIDALRVAMSRCWRIDANLKGMNDIKIVAHLSMRENGFVKNVWYDNETRAYSDKLFGQVLNSVKTAISVCQPFSMLPTEMYDDWKEIELTFYPMSGVVQ